MKIEEGQVARTESLYRIPVGGCFKLENCYYMKTSARISDSYRCVNLNTGHETTVDDTVYVCPVDATVVINKVGA